MTGIYSSTVPFIQELSSIFLFSGITSKGKGRSTKSNTNITPPSIPRLDGFSNTSPTNINSNNGQSLSVQPLVLPTDSDFLTIIESPNSSDSFQRNLKQLLNIPSDLNIGIDMREKSSSSIQGAITLIHKSGDTLQIGFSLSFFKLNDSNHYKIQFDRLPPITNTSQRELIPKILEALYNSHNQSFMIGAFNKENNKCFLLTKNNEEYSLNLHEVTKSEAKTLPSLEVKATTHDVFDQNKQEQFELSFTDSNNSPCQFIISSQGLIFNGEILYGLTVFPKINTETTFFTFNGSSKAFSPKGYKVIDKYHGVINDSKDDITSDTFDAITLAPEVSEAEIKKMFNLLHETVKLKNKKAGDVKKIGEYGFVKRMCLIFFLPPDHIVKAAEVRVKYNKKIITAWNQINRKLSIEEKLKNFKDNLSIYCDKYMEKLDDYQEATWKAFTEKGWLEKTRLQSIVDDIILDLNKSYEEWNSAKEIEDFIIYDICRTKPGNESKVRTHVFASKVVVGDESEFFIREYKNLISNLLAARHNGNYTHNEAQIEGITQIAEKHSLHIKNILGIYASLTNDENIVRYVKDSPCNKHPRGTRSIYRANIAPESNLIFEMDDFLRKHGGRYTIPKDIEKWNKEPGTLTYYPDYELSKEAELELSKITRKYARTPDAPNGRIVSRGEVITIGNPSGKPVSENGKVVNFLFTKDSTPSRIELLNLLRRAYNLDSSLGNAVFDMFTKEVTNERIDAMRRIEVDPKAIYNGTAYANEFVKCKITETTRELNDDISPELFRAIESTIVAIENGIGR